MLKETLMLLEVKSTLRVPTAFIEQKHQKHIKERAYVGIHG